MEIKLTTSLIGIDGARAGSILDLPQSDAKRLIEAGYAIPVPTNKKETTKAKKVDAENRSKGNKRKRKRSSNNSGSKSSSKGKS